MCLPDSPFGCGPTLFILPAQLRQLDVLGTRSLRTTTFGVSDLLTFLKIVELYALEGFGVKEDVFVRRRLDESETFVRQLFDRTFSHS